jgi:hypothetical protein
MTKVEMDGENVTAKVSRAMVASCTARGWVRKKGDGVGGCDTDGDAIIMEMPREAYDRLQEARQAPYKSLSDRIAKGQLPVDNNSGVPMTYERKEVRDTVAEKRRRPLRYKGE